jgi:hypothetical protein
MMHRLREAMRTGALGPLGGEGKIVEADETYFGKREDGEPRSKTELSYGRGQRLQSVPRYGNSRDRI